MYLLFELSVAGASLVERRRDRSQAAEPADEPDGLEPSDA
jgi:hypothetical protein